MNGRWRSKTEYRDDERLGVSGLSWEYLRRNERYQQTWREVNASDGPDPAAGLAPHWGLRFRG